MANSYEMHRTISRAFGDDPTIWDSARVLFRFDEQPKPHVIVQSLVEPDWSKLPSDYLVEEADIRPVSVVFTTATIYAFRLRANPTVKKDGKRRGILDEEKQIAWLNRKGDEGGFKVLDARINQEPKADFNTASGQAATMVSVRFDGALSVADPEKFQLAFERGIGSGKGVGFGLLSLARRK
jgi:CRISPR system Cascade subunit CasE